MVPLRLIYLSEVKYLLRTGCFAQQGTAPFVHLRCFIQDLSTSRNGEGGSEQIREGAHAKKTCRKVCFLFNDRRPY
jgi:hypothetical protein